MKFPNINIFDHESKRTYHYLHNHYPEFEKYLSTHFNFIDKWCEKLYCYYHKVNNHPVCPICGKNVNFISFNMGYHKFCSSKCLSNSEYRRNKIKETNLKKYGVENPFQSESIKDKIKETNLKKYGVENYSQTQEFQKKFKQTCLEKYGVDNPNKSQEIRNKTKQRYLERYGVDNPNKSQTIRNKTKQTCIGKYGVENPFQSESIKDKIKETNLKKYGVENYSQTQEFQKKFKQTCLEKYGVESPSQSQEVQNKMKQTCLERYGVENYSQSEEYQSRHEEIQTKINNTKHLNHTFNSSQIETEFTSYLISQNIEYIRQYGSKEYPFNCDFYLPKYNLYIEIQAGWFHGGHPYNEELDKDTLEIWKSKNTDFYNTAIETWTVRDTNKRNIAKLNNLKYLEIFSNDIYETIKTFEKYIVK